LVWANGSEKGEGRKEWKNNHPNNAQKGGTGFAFREYASDLGGGKAKERPCL